MMYKLEVISAVAQSKEYYFDSLEETLSEKKRIKELLDIELKENLENHLKRHECKKLHCQIKNKLKFDYEVRFRVSIARWEVIG